MEESHYVRVDLKVYINRIFKFRRNTEEKHFRIIVSFGPE